MASRDGARIAVLNWRDPWQRAAGGSEQYAYEMSLALVRAGATVDFLTAREPGQARREERDGVTWLRSGGRWTVYPRVLLRLLRRRLTGTRYDLVLDCQNGIPFFAPCVVSRRTPVVLLVHHVHDVQFGLHFPGPVAALGRWLEGPASRWAYRGSPAVAVSPSTVAAMRARLRWRGPIELIPNGLTGADELFGGDRARSPAPRVVAVGRLVRHKRVDQVVRLADELAAEWPGLEVHIVGTGPDEPAVRAAAAKLGQRGRAVVHGHLPSPERNELLRSAWIHVCASHGEGWGLCVVEAAACGVPTVAYDVDGLRDAVRDGRTGWLVRPAETLAAAVSRALNELESQPARAAEVGAACRDWAGEFDWKRSGDQLIELVGHLLFRAAAGRWRSWR